MELELDVLPATVELDDSEELVDELVIVESLDVDDDEFVEELDSLDEFVLLDELDCEELDELSSAARSNVTQVAAFSL